MKLTDEQFQRIVLVVTILAAIVSAWFSGFAVGCTKCS